MGLLIGYLFNSLSSSSKLINTIASLDHSDVIASSS